MTFKTLMGIRSNIIKSLLEIDTQIENLTDVSPEVVAKFEKRKEELTFFLEEIDKAELK